VAKSVDDELAGLTFGATPYGKDDSGEAIAQRLGVAVTKIDIDAWRTTPLAEIPHIAADCYGEEVHYTAAESMLKGKVLLTGFHGDKIWGKDLEAASEDLVRGDFSGLSLSEYRLWGDFIHCPMPFWGARQALDIIRISNMPDLKEWDVAGRYSRPICRRIVERAGVPRDLFGRDKRAASTWSYSGAHFLARPAMTSYLQWIRENKKGLPLASRISALASGRVDRALHKALKIAQGAAERAAPYGSSYRLLDRPRRALHQFTMVDWALDHPPFVLPLRRHIFPWAMEGAKRRYPMI